MKRIALVILLLLSFAESAVAAGKEDIRAALTVIEDDYRSFYLDGSVMLSLGAGVLGAGILANSSADSDFNGYFKDNIRSSSTDSLSDVARVPGDVLAAIPLLFGAYAISGDGAVKSWAGDSLRAFFVGAPSGLFLQYATGASRPEEGGSGWKPFQGNNGLSGHAFVGAVPFITAAKRQDSLAMKSVFYGLSILPGLSRINDEKHYISQAALGWWLAYLSTSVIENRDERASLRLSPFSEGGALVISPFPGGAGITLTALF